MSKTAVIKAVLDAWGPNVKELRVPEGPFEDHYLQDVEAVLHEFCHAATLKGRIPCEWGNCDGLQKRLDLEIEVMPMGDQDQNEADTIAAEFLVFHKLGLRICKTSLLKAGSNPTRLSESEFERLVAQRRRDKDIQQASLTVLAFITGEP